MQKKILIVEDDRKLNDGIRIALKNPEYEFYQSRTLKAARQALRDFRMDLLLLDVNLPDGNGIEFVREIRKYSNLPIIIITVNNMEVDIVTGLEAGANDYITKPFGLMELRARAEVQLRGKREFADRMKMGDFEFDFVHMKFYKSGEPLLFSKTEQRLLRILCENGGATVKREYLIDSVWDGDTEFVEEHALTVTIKRLRDKLGDDPKNPKYIKTVYGLGYTWDL